MPSCTNCGGKLSRCPGNAGGLCSYCRNRGRRPWKLHALCTRCGMSKRHKTVTDGVCSRCVAKEKSKEGARLWFLRRATESAERRQEVHRVLEETHRNGGTLADAARELGFSRERARQYAHLLGIHMGMAKTPCPSCGRRHRYSTVCKRQQKPSLDERISSKINVVGDCWIWAGSMNGTTPKVETQGKTCSVARYLYEKSEKIPPERNLVNTCGDTRCVRPEHRTVSSVPNPHFEKKHRAAEKETPGK